MHPNSPILAFFLALCWLAFPYCQDSKGQQVSPERKRIYTEVFNFLLEINTMREEIGEEINPLEHQSLLAIVDEVLATPDGEFERITTMRNDLAFVRDAVWALINEDDVEFLKVKEHRDRFIQLSNYKLIDPKIKKNRGRQVYRDIIGLYLMRKASAQLKKVKMGR
jgi:hypothetical protein